MERINYIDYYDPYEFTWARDTEGQIWIAYHNDENSDELWQGKPLVVYPYL